MSIILSLDEPSAWTVIRDLLIKGWMVSAKYEYKHYKIIAHKGKREWVIEDITDVSKNKEGSQ